jgi:2-oxoisovalerate dehydrogenase E1 component
MARSETISTDTPWLRLDIEAADWRAEDPAALATWLEQMLLIRRFEEKILELHGLGLVHGPAHAAIGQEAGAVGAMSVLGTADKINGTHRAHHQVLAKLVNAATPPAYDALTQEFAPAMASAVEGVMAEIMGLRLGFCGGRGGSMHMRHGPGGIPGTSAIIGGNLPHAAGYALADKLLGRDHVSVAFFGDGTLMAGAAYEAMNIAALHTLPVIFFLENNLYAVSTHVREQTRETRLSSRGPMLGIPAIEVDGMELLAVRRAMQEARRIIAAQGGPVMIEALCYRFLHQAGPRPGSEFGYRSREEEKEWQVRDPLATFPDQLLREGLIAGEGPARLDAKASALVAAAATRLTEEVAGSNQLRVPPGFFPDPVTVDSGIRGDLGELAGERFREFADYAPAELTPTKFAAAMSDVLARNMARDPRIIVMGEDVHRLRGGVSGATKGALERWPKRVLAMPIAENGFTGVALGAALTGLRPVVEIMFGDFCLVAADQLFNQCAKVRHMFGGDFPVPIVLRVRISPAAGYGSQHSGDPSGIFALYPGWRILAPATPFDYIGLMNSALRCEDPVVVLEHALLFQTEGPVPKDDLDYCVRLGSARVVRPGRACTVLTSAAMVAETLAATEETGIDAEVIDLRSLDPYGLDWPTIDASVKKTNRVMIAEQTTRGITIGPQIAAEIQARLLDHLDHEILAVTGGRASPTVSAPLNRAAIAGKAEVAAALRKLTAQ